MNFRNASGRLLAGLLMVLLCTLLAACSEGGETGGTSPTPGPAASGTPATPAPVAVATPLAPAEIEDVKEGDGDPVAGAGGLETTVNIWTDKFEGTPFGRGKVNLVLPLENSPLPGLMELYDGMKAGGVRRAVVSAGQLFDEPTLRMGRITPDARIYVELTLDKVFPSEPLETSTVTEGRGDRTAKKGDNLRVHYTGWLEGFDSEKSFDSSKGKSPFFLSLGAGQVIPGWDKGLEGMKAGEVRRLKIPQYLAYGNKEQGGIPKYSTLYFEVELVEFIEPGEMAIEIVTEGQGEPAKAGERVQVHYTGWLDGFDGKQMFDSSKKPGRDAFVFQLGASQVIAGWDQGVEGMKPGEIRRLTIPYNLAYGEGGRGPTIPPFATLYFEVEYLGTAPAETPAPATPAPEATK